MSEQQTAHETAFAEVIPMQPVCSGNVAVTVRISEVEANIHKGIPTKQVEHRLEGEDLVCPQCGDTMTEIGKEVVKTLEIVPAQYIVREDVYYTHACKSCAENADEGCEAPRCESITGEEYHPRQLCHPGSHCLHHDPKVRHGRTPVPAVKSLSKGEAKGSSASQGLAYCALLFKLEDGWTELTPEERYNQRLKQAKPVLDAMFAWANSRVAAPKSSLGKAFTYLKEQWPYLTNYLKDGRLELINNRAERSIKPFA